MIDCCPEPVGFATDCVTVFVAALAAAAGAASSGLCGFDGEEDPTLEAALAGAAASGCAGAS